MDLTEALRHRTGLPALLSAGHPAFAPKGLGVKMGFPASSAVSGPADAAGFVADRIAQKADYIKVLIEDAKIPGAKPLRPETIHAIVVAAHRANLIVVAHVTSVATLTAAVEAGVDVIAHAAIDGPLGAEFQEKLKSQPVVLTPTLVTLRSIIEKLVNMRIVRFLNWIGGRQLDYSYAQASVKTFREAGMVVLAGSDANNNPAAPHSPPFGDSLHEELELLVEAGLSPVEALQSATSLPAKVFGLTDRGVIEAGRRADLVLVEGDPTVDIKATRAIKGVWIAGTRVR
jgi:imidazolonepropionase-like amidohydrolase